MVNAAQMAAKLHSMLLLYLLEEKNLQEPGFGKRGSCEHQQQVPDILGVFTGREGSECQSLVFTACTVFFEDIKQKYLLNRSKQLLNTHLSFHFYPIFLLGLLAMSPLLCPQVLSSLELPHPLHSPAPWSTEKAFEPVSAHQILWSSACPSPAGDTAQTKSSHILLEN